ncbi:MAG: T9SS type A sorting domain-containing protein [Ignavibacteriales bacterium]|nr:T9SS type A sorting domain-containing protein [Ignavibacteriales bacterium]
MVYLRDGSILAGCYDPGLGEFGIYKTTNNGLIWINTNTISGLDYPSDFVLDTNDDVYVFIGGLDYDGVYLSSNNGNSWVNYGLSGYHPVTCLAIDSSGYLWAGSHLDGVYRTAGRTVPVELVSFSAEVNGNNVLLSWVTATEINNQGFEIKKQVMSSENGIGRWERIGFVEGSGTTTETKTYSFIDENVIDGIFLYRLKQTNFDGTFEYSNTIEVEISIPTRFSLNQNFPNPFNPVTSIQYAIANKQFVTLKVYDILGKEITTLVNENKEAGNYSVDFNAAELPSGVYIYQLTTPGFIQARKMILAK